MLDHIWFNDPEMFTSGILLCDVSDHCPTFLMHRLGGNETNEKVKVSFRHINSRNIDLFEQRISEIRWEFGRDINVDVSVF